MQAEPYIIGTGYHSATHHGPLNTSRPSLGYIQRYSCQRKGTIGGYPTCDNMPSISPVHELVEPGSKDYCSNVDLMNWNNAPSKYPSETDYKPLQLGGFLNLLGTPSEPVIPSELENATTEYQVDCGYPTSTNPNSWESEHPRNWSCNQVIEWLYYSVFVRDYENAQIENFRGISGKDLVLFKKSDFLQLLRSETYAERAYTQLQQHLMSYQYDFISSTNSSNTQSVINTIPNTNSYEPNNATYPYITEMYTDLEQPRLYNPNLCQYNNSDVWYNTSRSDVESDGECNRSPYTGSPYPDITLKHSDDDPRRPPKRGPGRPAGRESKKKKTGQRSSRLWEFIRDLLKDKETCPRLVKWEDRDEGVFRFVQSDQVAKLWGERKANPRMTYEKLSRAMRYYYKSKVLQPVLGRRLVYKFGPSATGWRPHET